MRRREFLPGLGDAVAWPGEGAAERADAARRRADLCLGHAGQRMAFGCISLRFMC
jgi:hypothetical protein